MSEAEQFVRHSNYPDGQVDRPDALCQLARIIHKGAYLDYIIDFGYKTPQPSMSITFGDGSVASFDFVYHRWKDQDSSPSKYNIKD